jgi:hypothetical protein
MRTGAWLLILSIFLFSFSKAHAAISWSGDAFQYSAADRGLYYDSNPGGVCTPLSAQLEKSSANGDAENSDVATASDSQTGLTTESAAWGLSFENFVQDSGGASVYGYADSICALDTNIGVLGEGQNVSSYISRPFTVTSTGNYTVSASASAPLAWSGTTSGTASAPVPQLTGTVQIFQVDPHYNSTTLLDASMFSLAGLIASPGQATVTFVAGDSYQLVVALSGVTSIGGQTGPSGIVTTFNNLDSQKETWLGAIDNTFNAGTQASPITLTASLSPSLWLNATALGGGWQWLSWFGFFNTMNSGWIYHSTLGSLYVCGTSTDNIWFYDPQWDGKGGWWWTTSSTFPWIYSATEQAWLYYDTADAGSRWFYNSRTGHWEKD